MKETKKTKKVMACHGPQLGDVWAAVNTAILNNYNLSRYAIHEKRYKDISRKIKEVKNLLEGGDEVQIVDNLPKLKNKFRNESLWKTPYVDTKIKWVRRSYGRMCYQFDGKTASYIKNLSRNDESLFFAQGFDVIRLGSQFSLKECVQIAATSDLFVGVCSGMSHVCHSVGVPVYLVGHPRLHQYHIGKEYVYCKDMKDFVRRYNNGYRLKSSKPIAMTL